MNSRRKQEGVLGLHSSSTRERERERGVGREAKPPLGTNDQTPWPSFPKVRTHPENLLSFNFIQTARDHGKLSDYQLSGEKVLLIRRGLDLARTPICRPCLTLHG